MKQIPIPANTQIYKILSNIPSNNYPIPSMLLLYNSIAGSTTFVPLVWSSYHPSTGTRLLNWIQMNTDGTLTTHANSADSSLYFRGLLFIP